MTVGEPTNPPRRPSVTSPRAGLGWKQVAVLNALHESSGTEDIQRFAARATQDWRTYLPPAETQRLMYSLIKRGLVERVGVNGYRAVAR